MAAASNLTAASVAGRVKGYLAERGESCLSDEIQSALGLTAAEVCCHADAYM